MQGPCGGCWAARRLLVAPTPAVAAGDHQSMDAQQAHLERVLSVTTAVLFLASVSYIALSTLYAYLRAARHDTVQQEPGGVDSADGPAPPREATKRALEGIPVRVVVIPRDAPDGGRKQQEEEDADADKDCAVCLAEYAGGDEVRVLPACHHGFHRDCVDRWLLTRAPTCPVCRAPVAVCLEDADAKEVACPTGHGGHLGDFAAWSFGLPARI